MSKCCGPPNLSLSPSIAVALSGFNPNDWDFVYDGTMVGTTSGLPSFQIDFSSGNWTEGNKKGVSGFSFGTLVNSTNPVHDPQVLMTGTLVVTGGTNPTVTNTVDLQVEGRSPQQFRNGPDLNYGPPPNGSYTIPDLVINTPWGTATKNQFGGNARTQAYPNMGTQAWTIFFRVFGNF